MGTTRKDTIGNLSHYPKQAVYRTKEGKCFIKLTPFSSAEVRAGRLPNTWIAISSPRRFDPNELVEVLYE